MQVAIKITSIYINIRLNAQYCKPVSDIYRKRESGEALAIIKDKWIDTHLYYSVSGIHGFEVNGFQFSIQLILGCISLSYLVLFFIKVLVCGGFTAHR